MAKLKAHLFFQISQRIGISPKVDMVALLFIHFSVQSDVFQHNSRAQFFGYLANFLHLIKELSGKIFICE